MTLRRFAIAITLFGAACGSPTEPAESPRPAATGKKGTRAAPGDALRAELLAEVPSGTHGPYLGKSQGGMLAVWAVPDGDARKWTAATLAADGKLREKPRAIAPAPPEIGLVAVNAAAKQHFIVVGTAPAEEQIQVSALLVDGKGALAAGPILLESGAAPVLWVDAVPTADGAIALWARQNERAADILAAATDAQGKHRDPERVATGARAWQVVHTPRGAALALVTETGVEVVGIDSAGRRAGREVVSATSTADLDLDAAAIGDRILVAWSDRRDHDARIQIALTDAAGKPVVPARAAIDAVDGDQALVRVVPPHQTGPAYIAWEAVQERPRGGRAIRLASVTSEGKLSSGRGVVRVAAEDGTVPELAASARGIAALTLAHACERGKNDAACAGAERLPTFVELDREFAPVATEPMLLAPLDGGAAELAWGLHCGAKGCFALAAVSTTPAPVYAVELAARTQRWRPPGGKLAEKAPPRPTRVETLAALDPLADASATRVGDDTLVAWVTHFDPSAPYQRLTKPAPDGRFDPLRARLEVRAVGKPTETLSLRARSLGGVSIAAGAPEHKEALLVWTALDAGQPQVFTTIVAADGKKRLQKMLTRSKGEVSDVAAAFVGDGWIVGWVDERHGDPEVYVTKVNRMLQRVVPERRLTSAAGAATGVSLAALGDRVAVVWADARDAEQPGTADPFALFLKASDASPIGKETRLATTRPHSFSPVVAKLGSAVVAGWIDADEAGGSVRIGQLDDNGSIAAPSVISLAGNPTALALECASASCRALVAADVGDRGELATFEWKPGALAPAAQRLAGLPGPAGQAAAPTVIGDTVYFTDQSRDRGRVRAMRVEWR